jgi:hypothetical protein
VNLITLNAIAGDNTELRESLMNYRLGSDKAKSSNRESVEVRPVKEETKGTKNV